MSDQRIRRNTVVQFIYTIADEQDNIIEQIDLPVKYIHGAGSNMGLIESVEKALEGSRAGDSIEVKLPPSDGFGEHNPELTFTDDLENIPPQFRHIGAQVQMTNDQGDAKSFVVIKIEDGKLTLDGNHPLAGKTATFSIRIVSVRDATADELQLGESNPNVNMPVH